jgi:hypothetical protein
MINSKDNKIKIIRLLFKRSEKKPMTMKTYRDRKGPLEFKIPLTKIKNPIRPKIKYKKINKNFLKYSKSKDIL